MCSPNNQPTLGPLQQKALESVQMASHTTGTSGASWRRGWKLWHPTPMLCRVWARDGSEFPRGFLMQSAACLNFTLRVIEVTTAGSSPSPLEKKSSHRT